MFRHFERGFEFQKTTFDEMQKKIKKEVKKEIFTQKVCSKVRKHVNSVKYDVNVWVVMIMDVMK